MLKNILFAFLIFTLFINAQQKQSYGNLTEALLSTGILEGKGSPKSLNWINKGDRYSYIKSSNKGDEIRIYNPKDNADTLVFNGKGINFPGTKVPFTYSSFQWAHDSRHILFQSNPRKIYRRSKISDYYYYSLSTKSLKLAVKDARIAQLSPDGSMIGIERNGNMFVYRFNTNKETQLTFDTSANIFNGHYDWVYEEEFGQPQAWNWSPDNKFIAYWHFNENGVPVFQMTNFEGTHPEYEKIRIPQPGDPNPKVKIGVIDIKTGKNIWLDTGEKGDFYIPRIYWTSEQNVLAVITLNRPQNDMKLFFFNVKTGKRKLVMEEKDNTWVAIYNFYIDVNDMIYFPKNIKEFFWISDRSGYYQIYRYNYDGKLINRVTNGNWDVIKVTGINPITQTIYYTSAEASPLEQQLYSIKFDGTNQKRLTEVPGYHKINMSPNCKYYLDEYSNIKLPKQVELWNTDGKMLKKLHANEQVTDYIKSHEYSYKQLFSFITSDGVKLDCSMIKPTDFDSTKKYPVILSIYGGPESEDVHDSFESYGWNEYLAQQGYIIVDVNNRGSANYGRSFMKIVYLHLGKWESHDFVETANYLKKLPYVDSTEMAIMGTSYGGYSTTFTMLTHPGVFRIGIANSPVTDWRLYDDIYTERYMGLLDDNLQGYIKSSDMTYADSLKGHLLLVHSMSDDNVHVRNTMQLLTALTNAGKDVDLRIYPLGAHGAEYDFTSDLLMHKVYFQYLQRYLKGKCNQPNIN